MNIPDHFSESLETDSGLKILKFFDEDADPGSRIILTVDPGSGIQIQTARLNPNKSPQISHSSVALTYGFCYSCLR
jgi:hypothetical protein